MSGRKRGEDVAPGAGHPRLVPIMGGYAEAASVLGCTDQGYPLGLDTAVLGGAHHQDVYLEGLPPAYGAIMHLPGDEYVYVQLDPGFPARVNGAPVRTAALHNGDRLQLGSHHLVFQRDEFADHGRYDGGRQGGEFSGDRFDRY